MQTAVELLIEQITSTYRIHLSDWEFPNKEYWIEMEKQQIIDAYQSGDGDAYNLDATKQWGEEYYNETYGSKGSVVAKRLKEEMPKHIADYVDAYAEQIANLEKSIIDEQLKNNR